MLDFLLGPLASAANDPYFYVLLPFLWMLMRHLSRAPTTTEQMEREQAWLTHTCRELHRDAPGYVREYLDEHLDAWDFANAIAGLPAPRSVVADLAPAGPPTEKDRAIAREMLRVKQEERAIRDRVWNEQQTAHYRSYIEQATLDAALREQYTEPLHDPTNGGRPIILTGGMTETDIDFNYWKEEKDDDY